ncbi:hypothetical protein C0J52_09834 [Blattella germanica]|nr:hypothetical protein C0J52_09834 [Blattella germanica]
MFPSRLSLDINKQTTAYIRMRRRMPCTISYVLQKDANFIYLGWDVCNFSALTKMATLRVFAAQASR